MTKVQDINAQKQNFVELITQTEIQWRRLAFHFTPKLLLPCLVLLCKVLVISFLDTPLSFQPTFRFLYAFYGDILVWFMYFLSFSTLIKNLKKLLIENINAPRKRMCIQYCMQQFQYGNKKNMLTRIFTISVLLYKKLSKK